MQTLQIAVAQDMEGLAKLLHSFRISLKRMSNGSIWTLLGLQLSRRLRLLFAQMEMALELRLYFITY